MMNVLPEPVTPSLLLYLRLTQAVRPTQIEFSSCIRRLRITGQNHLEHIFDKQRRVILLLVPPLINPLQILLDASVLYIRAISALQTKGR